MRRCDRLLPILLLFYSLSTVYSLRVCTRRHFRVHSTAILQRLELTSAEKCVERCIENLHYCFIAQFIKNEGKELGLCNLYSKIENNQINPDATVNPLSIIYEILEKCPPFTASDITHRISKLHRDALQDGRESDTSKERLADAFFPEKDRFGGDEELRLEGERYAVMKSIEEVEIEAAKHRAEMPRDPFNDGPRFHQSSHERDRIETNRHYNRNQVQYKGEDGNDFENDSDRDEPIHPIISHRGQSQQMSAPMASGHACLPNSACARTLYQSDSAPCPARKGDPCAPRQQCSGNDCYPIAEMPSDQLPTPEWTEWTQCSASCGLSIKTRQCLGGISCVGMSSQACQLSECASWTLWTPWSLCSASCGVGEKERTRICQTGRNCPGPSHEVEACKALIPCPSWSSWTAWTGCTNTCGKGIERRSRLCQNGLLCPGSPTEERTCDRGPCPHWSAWSQWDQCDKECGGGHTFRTRDCIDGPSCEGASEEKLLCNQQPCPEWSQWTAWTVCDEKCGEETIRLRNRKCLHADNNNACIGPAQDQTSCPYRECPKWEEWSEWSDCSTTCGQGVQKRNRKCDSRIGCQGPSEEMRFCQVASCPYWGDWSAWSGCSVTCGRGVCQRSRRCVTDEFLHLPTLEEFERDDSLEKLEAKEALIARAKTISKYHRTNETRFSPRHSNLRQDQNRPPGGTCDGPENETKSCDAGPCCHWDSWSEWSPCIGCGSDGISKRNRVCSMEGRERMSPAPPPLSFQDDNRNTYVTPNNQFSQNLLNGLAPIVPVEIHRGKRQVLFGTNAPAQCHCPGESFQTRRCPDPLPCDDPHPRCEWSNWGEWCGCMKCRPGTEVRRRFCDRIPLNQGGPYRPNDQCDCGPGNDKEERDCPVEPNCYSFRASIGHRPTSHERQNHRDRSRENGSRHFSQFNNGFNSRNSNPSNENFHQKGLQQNQRGRLTTSKNKDEYVPIDSVIGRVQLGESSSDTSYKKDSADVFETTEYPFKICHWSKWSDWSSCVGKSTKERKRFCVGEKDKELISNCECVGKSHEEETCKRPDGFVEESAEESDKDFELNLDKLLETSEDDILDEKTIEVSTRSHNTIECEWTRWSQWSVCTVTCGEGKRMRKRRCPCGDDKCGHGNDSDSEVCHNQSCDVTKTNERQKPIFTILPSTS